MCDLLGRALLSRLLISDGTLHGRRLRVHRDFALCAFHASFCCLGVGLRGFGIGDGFDAVGLFALLGLGLLELSLATVSESLPVTAPAISFALPFAESIKPCGPRRPCCTQSSVSS